MKQFLKYALLGILGVVILIVLAIGGWIGYLLFAPGKPVAPASYPWTQTADEDLDRIAAELVEQMSLEEKIDQMVGEGLTRLTVNLLVTGRIPVVYSGHNERLKIPPIAFTDGPRGIVTAPATAFPVAMARGATWDVELESRVGEVFGKEARAAGANYFGGICVNLLRHPSWGRAQETYSEDPWLLGEMALAVLHGVQRHNVMGCAKHYLLNSIENSRYQVNVELDERTLREVYLPPWKKLVDAGVASIMSAYNRVRGEFCGHNRAFLTGILRDEWSFAGFVSSDWVMGLRDAFKGVKAGLDVEMPGRDHYQHVPGLIQEGRVEESEIDQIVRRIVRTKLAFVTRKDPMSYPRELLASAEHVALAREVAEQSMVLLKNQDGLLPLDRNVLESIALIGRLIEEDNTGDRGSSAVSAPYVVTPLEGLRAYLGEGVSVLHSTGEDLEEVKRLAQEADAVIVLAGFRYDDEGEYVQLDDRLPRNASELQAPFGIKGGDRYPLGLRPHDISIIRAVAPLNYRFVVSLVGGSAITMEEWERDAPAILMAWYFGMEGANALTRILFGEVNPSGRLPFTIPREVSQLPPFDPFAPEVEYGYYHGYTLFDKTGAVPAFPFGFGLSYTDFAYDRLEVESLEVGPQDQLRVSVEITNTGPRPGREVVQLYVGFENSSIDRPVKLLRGFEKIELEPGETRQVRFSVPVPELAWYDPQTGTWDVERMEYSVRVGPSSDSTHQLESRFLVR